MPGKDKYAKKMGEHVGEALDSACPIGSCGAAGAQVGGAIGGAIGAVAAGKGGGKGAPSDVDIPQFAWLGLGPAGLVITKSSAMGKPTGEPLVRAAYGEVTGVELTEGKITLRADLDLADGRHVAFETKRLGNGKQSVEVFTALRDRTTVA